MAAPLFDSAEVTVTPRGSSGDSVSVNVPANAAENDLLIAVVQVGDGDVTGSLAPDDAGWTPLYIERLTFGQSTIGAWRRNVPASPPASYGFSWTSGSGSSEVVGAISLIKGQDLADPIDAWDTDGASSANGASPSVTTTVDDCLILHIVGCDNPQLGGAGYPAGDTGVYSEATGSPSPRTETALAYRVQASAGATGVAAWSMGGSDQWSAGTVAVRPAAAGGGEEAVLPGALMMGMG